MKYLNESDINLDDLMDDLRDLGIGDYKVYLRIRKRTMLSGKYSSELGNFVKVHFPGLEKSRGEIKYEEIILSIINKEYLIEIHPNRNSSTEINAIYRGIDYRMKEILTRDKDIRNFGLGGDFIYDDIFNKNKLISLMKSLANSFNVATEIDLLIDGSVKETVNNNDKIQN